MTGGYGRSHRLNDFAEKPVLPRYNNSRTPRSVMAHLDRYTTDAAPESTFPRVTTTTTTPTTDDGDDDDDDRPLPRFPWSPEKPLGKTSYTEPSTATSTSFPTIPSSTQPSTAPSESGRPHRGRFFGRLEAFRKPTNTAPSSRPSISSRIKGFIRRDKSSKNSNNSSSNSSSIGGGGGGGSSSGRPATTTANADSDDPFEQLVNSDGTIHLTLTPARIANLDKQEPTVPRLRARAPRVQADSLNELSQFIRSTGPPRSGANSHESRMSIVPDSAMEDMEDEMEDEKDREDEGDDRDEEDKEDDDDSSKRLSAAAQAPAPQKLLEEVPLEPRRKARLQARGVTTATSSSSPSTAAAAPVVSRHDATGNSNTADRAEFYRRDLQAQQQQQEQRQQILLTSPSLQYLPNRLPPIFEDDYYYTSSSGRLANFGSRSHGRLMRHG